MVLTIFREVRSRIMISTKEKIVDLMCHLVAEKGYDKTSIGQICEIIGIKKPSVYYYFKSKEEIFLYMIEDMIKKGFREISVNPLRDNYTVEAYKTDLIEGYIEIINQYKKNENYSKVIMELLVQSNRIESVQDILNHYSDKIRYYLLHVLEVGEKIGAFNDSFDRKLNAELLYTTMQGIECAIVFNLSIDDPIAVWTETVNRMFVTSRTD